MAALTQSLQQRQQQSLVMTQQLQQSIKLLQLSSQDLQAYVAGEMEQNPLLQEPEADNSAAEEAQRKEEDTPQEALGEAYGEETVQAELADRGERQSPAYEQSSRAAYTGEGENLIEKLAHEKPDLRSYLREHLYCSTDDMMQRMIGLHVIDSVNAAGYLPESMDDIAQNLQCSAAELVVVVELLQQCEPAGLCARNVAECLGLQLADKGELTESMQALVANLELLGKAEHRKLARQCGVPLDELQEMITLLRSLDPKPGFAFDFEEVQSVQPDVFVSSRGRDWEIELNPSSLPKVLVNRDYYTLLSQSTRDKEEKTYLGDQLSHANWLVKALDQRAQTLLKTSRAIVEKQANFFRHGLRYLKPLTLKEIAEAIDMHESTISRVTTQKYLSHGGALYELKFFFTSSVGSSFGGDDISSKAVQHRIEQLVGQEDSAKTVLSDEAIAAALNAEGMNIARRTVAKYRDIQKIPSSAQRKRVFKAQVM